MLSRSFTVAQDAITLQSNGRQHVTRNGTLINQDRTARQRFTGA